MLVGSVVGNEIRNESEPSPMGLRDQSVQIREVPEDPRHIAIICDVKSKIRHGGRIIGGIRMASMPRVTT